MGIDPKGFEFAVGRIENGFIFEEFVCNFLAHILGYEFVPAGGIKDRGIDGLEHTFHRKGYERNIYQVSIEKNSAGKVRASLDKLRSNRIKFEQFFFVTNQEVKKQDQLIDALFDEFKKPIHIWDLLWLSSRVNTNQGTLNAFHTFVESYFHEFSAAGKSYVVGDLVNDPRLFVFLRQQWDHDRENAKLDDVLADSLILFSLEGTDPDKGIFETRDEINMTITKSISFDPKSLYKTIDKRLEILSTKPRKIKHHRKLNAYCLPYETRLEIQNSNLEDARLHEAFHTQSAEMLRQKLGKVGVRVKDCLALMETAFNRIYYQQGLEFANFVLKGENQEAFEKDLGDTIRNVVDESPVVTKHKEIVKSILMMVIREIVYNGSNDQKRFLQKLSNTYLMLFLLQCDPKLGTYFSSLAAKMNVYVCTSIIIPAMSEFYLKPENRRHWNLLKGAYEAGVHLVINETILGELISHFQMIINKYEDHYKHEEDVYINDEIMTLYIDEIMIRAYFYERMRGNVLKFSDFIDNFVSPNLADADRELKAWLKEEFGIDFVSDASLCVSINGKEEEKLIEVLRKYKSVPQKAKNDSKLILTIYAIRDKQNEGGTNDIFGYRTWWLSKDTTTLRAVNETFKDKYQISCYMRPDFLYNYISLAPHPANIQESFNLMFPTLLGVNISYHLPQEIIQSVNKFLQEHKVKNRARRTAILQSLAEKLRTDVNCRSRSYVKHYLDEQLKELTGG